jgi:hypothetical protein
MSRAPTICCVRCITVQLAFGQGSGCITELVVVSRTLSYCEHRNAQLV